MKIETAIKVGAERKLVPGLAGNMNRCRSSLMKRLMDIALAGPLFIFLLPFLLLTAIIVRLQDGGPAIFVQKRVGLDGQLFNCFKFRSMRTDAAERLERLLESDPAARAEWDRDQKLRNDPRVTRLGRILRKTSIDELPQLWNILRGEMSIIGPRPITTKEIVRYGANFDAYCSVRPGVTGLWQVSGRNDTTYDERVALDVYYATSWSIWLDIEIIIKTVPAILFSKGAY